MNRASQEPEEQSDTPQRQSRNGRILSLLALAWIALAVYLLLWFDVSSGISTSDDLGHGLLFLCIAATMAAVRSIRASKARLFRLFLGLSALAGLAELAQHQLTNERTPEWSDFFAGSFGALLGVGIIALLGGAIGARRWFEPTAIVGSTLALFGLGGAVLSSAIGLPERIQCRNIPTEVQGVDESSHPSELIRLDGGIINGPEGLIDSQTWGVDPPAIADSGLKFSNGQSIELPEELGESLYCSAIKNDALTVVIDLSPSDLEQTGPARIITMSEGIDRDQIDFHVAQQADGISIRIRTTDDRLFTTTVPDVFESTEHQRLAIVISNGELQIIRDGVQIHIETIRSGTLRGWTIQRPVTIGNEHGGDREFAGEIHFLAIYSEALDQEEIGQVFALSSD